LASDLTGYKLDMMLEEEYRARQQNEAQQYLDMFVSRLDIEEDLAMALVEMGFTSLEEMLMFQLKLLTKLSLMLNWLSYCKVVQKKQHLLML